jgi:dipeptidase E
MRTIFAMGGGGFTMEPDNPVLDEFILGLARRPVPRVCFLPTASGDPLDHITRFHEAFSDLPCEATDLSLFRLGRRAIDLRRMLLSQDIVYVGGGSLRNMLAIWRVHELDAILRECWARRVVLAGLSAGAMCWFEAGITKSSGRPLAAAGLGLLGGSLCVHYNNEPERRAAYLDAVGDGMPGGYGLDDYAGLLWEGEGTPSAVTARRGARAYRVSKREGEVAESPLPARFLPAPAPAALREDIAEFRRIKTMRRRAGWLG